MSSFIYILVYLIKSSKEYIYIYIYCNNIDKMEANEITVSMIILTLCNPTHKNLQHRIIKFLTN
jgi:hypothetical protein